jgi:hypothetical protein
LAETGAASASSGQAPTSDVTPADAELSANADAAPSESTKSVVDDDPEEDWGDGLKLKKSEARERLKRQREFERASHKRMQDAAAERKAAAAERESTKRQLEAVDIDAILQQRGINPDQWAENRLTKSLQRQTMTPEQLENEQLRTKLEQLEGNQKKTAEIQKQERHQALTKQYFAHFDQLIGESMTKFGKLPKTPAAVGKVADVMAEYLDAEGNLQIDPMLAMEIAYDNAAADTRQLLESIVGSNDPRSLEQLEELIGPKVMQAVQRRAIAKAQGLPANPAPKQQRQTQPKTETGQFMTMEEARKRAGMRI